MDNLSHNGVTGGLFCLMIGLYLYEYRSAIGVVASMPEKCTCLCEKIFNKEIKEK